MAVCIKIKGKKRRICVGDLDREIILENRSITPPSTGVDYTEVFSTKTTGANPEEGRVMAMVMTVSGDTFFDSTNVERDITHHFYINYMPDVTAETWIQLEDNRFDIIDVEDLDYRHEFLKLRCVIRGANTNSVNAQ